MHEMRVIKRDCNQEEISFDKILRRIKNLGLNACLTNINYPGLAMKVIEQLHDNIETKRIDELAAEQCASMSTIHYDYGTLAARIIISNHQKNTEQSFSKNMNETFVSEELYQFVQENAATLDAMIVDDRDYLIDYFGFKTLEKSYLFKDKSGRVFERIQHMWLRVSIGIHYPNLLLVKETYDLMSQKYFIHATPTLFNAGTKRPQLSSCYLIAMESDSIDGIYNTLKDCALISKYSGGIGLHIHNIRAKDSHIQGTNGKTDGIVPMLKVFNATARYVNQAGKRNGSFAIYLEPWHPDIESFLELRTNHGDEESKARDLFYAIWTCDLFMERIKANGDWSLFCPNECPGLSDVYSDEFVALYNKYEGEKKARKVIKARDLWFKILDSQMETGTPYILYKDSVNKKSNQKNIGVIKSSNLCSEIVQVSDDKETAVCNLASIGLPTFINNGSFDYDMLHRVVTVVTNNLNRVIDINFYPTEKTRYSNMRHRPVGIGVQGLADVFVLLGVPFCSPEAKEINQRIFETIYHAALEKSCELAAKEGPYESYAGSPASNGQLQYDLWSKEPKYVDFSELKANIQKHGLRNSLLVAPMPTASTSQILGFNECFEPFTSNLYSRRTMAGEFVVVNKYLMKELVDMGLWNEQLKNSIIANQGSVQHIAGLSEELKEKYKIVWEMPMKHIIDLAADRGAFICQSQSMNLWVEDPNYSGLTSMHFYSWTKGLKTGMYYLRRKAAHKAQQFTIEPAIQKKSEEVCEMCSA